MKVKLNTIAKIQRNLIKIFEAEDSFRPNRRVAKACDTANKKYLQSITDDVEIQNTIITIIEKHLFNFKDTTWKPICDDLRALGFEVISGTQVLNTNIIKGVKI